MGFTISSPSQFLNTNIVSRNVLNICSKLLLLPAELSQMQNNLVKKLEDHIAMQCEDVVLDRYILDQLILSESLCSVIRLKSLDQLELGG